MAKTQKADKIYYTYTEKEISRLENELSTQFNKILNNENLSKERINAHLSYIYGFDLDSMEMGTRLPPISTILIILNSIGYTADIVVRKIEDE